MGKGNDGRWVTPVSQSETGELAPLPQEIHLDCIRDYTTAYLDSLLESLIQSTRNFDACGLSRVFVIVSMIQEMCRRKAKVVDLTPDQLDLALRHIWPEFICRVEDQEMLQNARRQGQREDLPA